MLHGNGNEVCWISSIVQLPNFYKPGTILAGAMYADADATERYLPFQLQVWQNRDIRILDDLYKYKLEISSTNGYVGYFVGLSTTKFNITNVADASIDENWFFPIYMHIGGTCVLFVDAINKLFRRAPALISSQPETSDVISPAELILTVAELSCMDVPCNQVLTDLAYIRRDDSVVSLIMNSTVDMMSSSTGEAMVNRYMLTVHNTPNLVQQIRKIRCIGHLRLFMNPYGSVPSDIAAVCMMNTARFDEIAQHLQKQDALPVFSQEINLTEPEDFSLVGRWLSGIFMQPYSDYQFPLRVDMRDCSDLYAKKCNVYDGFKSSFDRINDARHFLDCVGMSFSFGAEDGKEYIAQRSWLEDVVVRDPATNEIVLYLDLIPWILACADGLINRAVISKLV